MVGRADARQHQQLRRADRARAEEHLTLRAHRLLAAAAVAQHHPDGALALQRDPRDVRARAHLEVRAVPRGAQVRVGGRPAAAVALGDLHERRAVLLGAVVVGDARDADALGGLQEAPRQAARRALVHDVQRPADGVVLGGAALVVLGLEEVGTDVLPPPAARALGLPQVVVQRPAADVQHGVHRARPAQGLAARDEQRAPVAVRLGLGAVVPVQLGVELLGEARRDHDVGVAVLAAGLDEQHPDGRVLRQPVGEDAAGRAGADDDVVHGGHGPMLADGAGRAQVAGAPGALSGRGDLVGQPLQVVHARDARLLADLLHDRHQRAGADAAVVAHAAAAGVGDDVADAAIADGLGQPAGADLALAAGEAAQRRDVGAGVDDGLGSALLAGDPNGPAAVAV